jgi:ABC-type dipeptide/oligopeptide/nickel transport system ATPase component
MVMYAGRIAEQGTRNLFKSPWHPYTWGSGFDSPLGAAAPEIHRRQPPSLLALPPAAPLHPLPAPLSPLRGAAS